MLATPFVEVPYFHGACALARGTGVQPVPAKAANLLREQAPIATGQQVVNDQAEALRSVTPGITNSKGSSSVERSDRSSRRKQMQKMRRKLGRMEREANAAPDQPEVDICQRVSNNDMGAMLVVAAKHVHSAWSNLRKELLHAPGCCDAHMRTLLLEALMASQANPFMVPPQLVEAVAFVETIVSSLSNSVISAASDVVKAVDVAQGLFGLAEALGSVADQETRAKESHLDVRQMEAAAALQEVLHSCGMHVPKALCGVPGRNTDCSAEGMVNPNMPPLLDEQHGIYHRCSCAVNDTTTLPIRDELASVSEADSVSSHGCSSRRSSSVPCRVGCENSASDSDAPVNA